MFQGVVNRIFWNPEYIFVPMNASWQEHSWLADCGKGCDCGTVHKIITKICSYTKRCVMSRQFSWYQFGNRRPLTFPVNRQLVWWNHYCPRTWDKGFFTWECLSHHIQISRIRLNCFLVPPYLKYLSHYLPAGTISIGHAAWWNDYADRNGLNTNPNRLSSTHSHTWTCDEDGHLVVPDTHCPGVLRRHDGMLNKRNVRILLLGPQTTKKPLTVSG